MRHRDLVAVLAAAHVEEVVRVRVERLAEARGGVLEAEPAPLAARAQHGDVAAVGVDVHQLRIERQDPQRRHRTTVLPMWSSVSGIVAAADRLEPRGARLRLELSRLTYVERDPAVVLLDLPARRHGLAAALDHHEAVVVAARRSAGSRTPSRRARACREAAEGRARP